MGKLISSKSVSHKEIVDMMTMSWFQWNYLLDPHTAIGMSVAIQEKRYRILSNDENLLTLKTTQLIIYYFC